MLDIMDIAYFNYMEECDKKQTLNNRSSDLKKALVGEEATQKPDYEAEKDYPGIIPPLQRKY